MAKILSVTEIYNWYASADYIRKVKVTYDSYECRTYKFGEPATVKKFMETHEKTTTEMSDGKMVFHHYE